MFEYVQTGIFNFQKCFLKHPKVSKIIKMLPNFRGKTPFILKSKDCEHVVYLFQVHRALFVHYSLDGRNTLHLVSSSQVWPLTLFYFCFLFVKKIIDLSGGQITDPKSGKPYSLPFLPATPSCKRMHNLDCAFVENALFYTDP